MADFDIVISDTPYEMQINPESSILINSVFFIRTFSGSFPYENWTDFPIQLLSQWCENMVRMPIGEAKKCTLPFMDGPYWLDVERRDSVYVFQGRWAKKNYGKDFQEPFAFQCSLEEFFAEIIHAFRQIIVILNQKQAAENVRNEVKRIYQHYRKLIEEFNQRTVQNH